MGTHERRQREGTQRRQSILDAAKRVFWTGGYGGATMPQVAQTAELAPGTLYLYFPSKAAMYAELLHEGYGILLERLAAAASGADEPQQRAGAMIDAFLGFAGDCPEYFDIIFFILQREGGAEGNLEPEQLARLKEGEAACRAVVSKVLGQIDSVGPARAEASVGAIWSMLAGVVFYFKGEPDFDNVAAEARRILLRAVLGTDPAGPDSGQE